MDACPEPGLLPEAACAGRDGKTIRQMASQVLARGAADEYWQLGSAARVSPNLSSRVCACAFCAILDCELFAVLGTEDYGKNMSGTCDELVLAWEENKPMFLIKTFLGSFNEEPARIAIQKSRPDTCWCQHSLFSSDDELPKVVDAICKQLAGLYAKELMYV
jgi:hypothetical protein